MITVIKVNKDWLIDISGTPYRWSYFIIQDISDAIIFYHTGYFWCLDILNTNSYLFLHIFYIELFIYRTTFFSSAFHYKGIEGTTCKWSYLILQVVLTSLTTKYIYYLRFWKWVKEWNMSGGEAGVWV